MFDRLIYMVNEARRNLRAAPTVTWTSIGIIALAFLVFATFLLVVLNVSDVLERWSADIRIDVYLDENTPADGVSALVENITGLDGVSRVAAVSKDEALAEFREMLGEDAVLLDSLPDNPLPPSVRVYLTDAGMAHVAPLAESLRALPHVTEVRAGTDWLDQLSGVMTMLRVMGFGVGGILFLASALIISNVIRLSVYARRDEIEIMQLVGATRRFITTPFYIEGAVTGAGAAILALALLRILFALFLGQVTVSLGALGGMTLTFLPWSLVAAFFVGGVVLGLGGSAVALNRMMEY